VTMWERRAEPEGFAAVMEGVRNAVPRLKGRAIAGAHDYQDPRIDRAEQAARCEFLRRFDARLAEVPFVAGDTFSAADITTLVTVDFARRAFDMPVPAERPAASVRDGLGASKHGGVTAMGGPSAGKVPGRHRLRRIQCHFQNYFATDQHSRLMDDTRRSWLPETWKGA
jgi:hypothetical protein